MPLILNSIIANHRKPHHPFLLLQSSLAQSALPVLHEIVNSDEAKGGSGHVVLVCVLHAPSTILKDVSNSSSNDRVTVLNWTSFVPGYDGLGIDARIAQVQKAIDGGMCVPLTLVNDALQSYVIRGVAAPSGPVTLVIDSVNTLHEDFESESTTYQFLSTLLAHMRRRGASSRLALHISVPSPLIALLQQTSFSSSLTHITTHPPVLLIHIATAYLTPPPDPTTISPLPHEKFWRVFTPISDRHHDVEELIFGSNGEGAGSTDEMVVELLVRGGGGGTGGHGVHVRRKGVERWLEGWASKTKGGCCELSDLVSLKGVWGRSVPSIEAAIDPTEDLSFNLNLTPSQQQLRSQVPLPYAHEGHPPAGQGQILYDPDSADDIDDEDPDEDLDI